MSLQGYRLKGYNYATARGYMVTLKMHPQAEPLVELDASRKQAYRFTRLTRPFMDAITQRLPAYFHQYVKVEQYALMPNHLLLFIRLLPCKDRAPINLIHVVHQLQRFLKEAYQTTTGETACASPIQAQWHDSIAFDKAAVQRLKAYIRNNPKRALQRQTSHFCTYQTGPPCGAIMATVRSLNHPPSSPLNARAKSNLRPRFGSDGKTSHVISRLVAQELEPL